MMCPQMNGFLNNQPEETQERLDQDFKESVKETMESLFEVDPRIKIDDKKENGGC